MPRVGRHPLKSKKIKDEPIVHQKVTVTTIVHIPMLSGYWENSLEVLKVFFESLSTNTNLPFDLMVFDNGSCLEVRSYLNDLHHAGKIQYLIFSQQNLRKLGALNFLLSSAPGDYIAYADSDVYFLPDWLDESLKVLEAFPEAGKVTALPIVGGDTTELSKDVFSIAQRDPTINVNTGILVPDKYVEAHRLSLGRSSEVYERRLENRKDVVLKRNGVEALLSGADFQFVIKQKASREILPLRVEKDEEYFDPIYSPVLEHRLDKAGFWQLSTYGYYVHHMGNHVPDFNEELPWVNKSNFTEQSRNYLHTSDKTKDKRLLKRLLMSSKMRKILVKIYSFSYRLLYK